MGYPRLQTVAYSFLSRDWWAGMLDPLMLRRINFGIWCDRSSQPHRAGRSQFDELYTVRVVINRKREARCTVEYAVRQPHYPICNQAVVIAAVGALDFEAHTP